MQKVLRFFGACCAVLGFAVLGLLCFETHNTATHYWVSADKKLYIDSFVTVSVPTESAVKTGTFPGENSYAVSLKLFGVIPIRDATVSVAKTSLVVPCGTPFGIKLYTDGVIVVGFSDVDTESESINPAQNAGIRTGDIILSVNGETIRSTEQLASVIEQTGNAPLQLKIQRNAVTFTVQFCAAKSKTEGRYKAGLWVRDSSAGIGTMTFYDPDTMTFAGLGHAICDVDTGKAMPLYDGEIVPARIYGIKKSTVGTPGGLLGGFEFGTLGTLEKNENNGVFGTLSAVPTRRNAVPLAMKQDIYEGEALMLTTIDGTTPTYYTVNIEKVSYSNAPNAHNMVIEITDERLLNATGGIVQGMSGSPLLQNGKLIGAVTHVFVNDPARGYGIFAENMLETAHSVVLNNGLQEAS